MRLIYEAQFLKKSMKQQKSKNNASLLFIDFKSAFDSLNHDTLFTKLENFNIKEEWINTVKMLYKHTKISTDGTASYSVNKGVIQGGILSPNLFNMYIDDLA
jgi:hypothetical protein